MQELTQIITTQQKGHKEDPIYMIGEQLKDICRDDPSCIEILKRDLQVTGMDLKGAAGALQAYADKNHKNGNCFVISPALAETILREFYGLPAKSEKSAPVQRQAARPMIDLESFI